MREIKFRVWHLWGEGFSILTLDEFCNKPKKFHDTYYKNSIEQFTGLQDKNCVDIYEGDKVIVIDNMYDKIFEGTVKFKYASFTIEDECLVNHFRWIDFDVEVIGNIHE